MTTQEVATELVHLCRDGNWEEIYQKLFSPDIESMEPKPHGWETASGMEGIRAKAARWEEMVDEFVPGEISEPIVAGNHFACTMKSRVKFKNADHFTDFDEICLYHVVDGKVVREQFFYEQ